MTNVSGTHDSATLSDEGTLGGPEAPQQQGFCLSPEEILQEIYSGDHPNGSEPAGFVNTVPWGQKWLDKDVWAKWGNRNA